MRRETETETRIVKRMMIIDNMIRRMVEILDDGVRGGTTRWNSHFRDR